MTDDVRRSRTAFLWVGIVLPLVLIAVATAVVAAWLPEIPERAAIHWGTGGVDGYGPGWTYLLLPIGIGGGMVVLFGLMALFSSRLPPRGPAPTQRWSSTSRLLGGMNLGAAGMISLLAVVSVGVQRGLSDAADTPGIGLWVGLGFIVLIGLTALGWFLQPTAPRPAAGNGTAAERVPLAAGEKVAWIGTANMSRIGVVVLLSAIVFLAIRAGMLIAEGDAGWWIYGVAMVVIALLISSSLAFRVRVNVRGLSARSLLGWPRTQIPLSDIERVETVEIDPFQEFGGWGWRLGRDGRRGIVLRTGEALQVTQSSGRVFAVTLDGASEAAAVLETLRAAPTSSMNRPIS